MEMIEESDEDKYDEEDCEDLLKQGNKVSLTDRNRQQLPKQSRNSSKNENDLTASTLDKFTF